MRKKLIVLCRYISLSLLFATLSPLTYFDFWPETAFGWPLYFKSLLILFPVAATDFAICKAKSLTAYLFSSLGIFSLTAMLSWLLGPILSKDSMFTGYSMLIWVETLFLIICRYSIHRKRQTEYLNFQAGEENEVSFGDFLKDGQTSLDKPQLSLVSLFVAAYVFGLFCQNPTLCNITLSGTICYLFLFLLYTYLQKTEEYLSLHKRVRGVPRKRIYGIGRTMFLLLSLMLLLGIIPGLLSINARKYKDIRNLYGSLNITYENEEMETESMMADPWFTNLEGIEPKEPPKWLDDLFTLIISACGLAFVVFVGKTIRQAFLDFRNGSEENGDIVENLKDEPEEKISSLFLRRKAGESRDVYSIRKKYRRMILRSRKEVPMAWESPAEMEDKAGLGQDEKMQKLHREYEKARYR